MQEKEEEGPQKYNILHQFNKRFNIIVLLLLIAALATCYYTLNAADKYQDKCNDHWAKEIAQKCICSAAAKYNDSTILYAPLALGDT